MSLLPPNTGQEIALDLEDRNERGLAQHQFVNWLVTAGCDHEWKRAIPRTVRRLWHTFTWEQRCALIRWARRCTIVENDPKKKVGPK